MSSSCEFLFLGRCSSEFELRVCEIYLKSVEFEFFSSENSSEFEFLGTVFFSDQNRKFSQQENMYFLEKFTLF